MITLLKRFRCTPTRHDRVTGRPAATRRCTDFVVFFFYSTENCNVILRRPYASRNVQGCVTPSPLNMYR